MKTYTLAGTDLAISRLGYGCMTIGGDWGTPTWTAEEQARAEAAVRAALEQGFNFFDHADIYTRGKSEALFGELLKREPGLRQQVVIQSKCGIRFPDEPPGTPGRYDWSYAHIVASVEASLRRLNTDYLDILLLHRPDPLAEAEEVARAFDTLHQSGKVRHFGVSNQSAAQMALVQSWVDQPLLVNQLQLSLLHADLINDGVMINRHDSPSGQVTGTLEYCRQHHVLVQAWGPQAGGKLTDPAPDAAPHVLEVARVVAELAERHQVPREAIGLAWLLRLPAGIQPIIGTTRPERIAASAAADTVQLSREEWYQLLTAARGARVP